MTGRSAVAQPVARPNGALPAPGKDAAASPISVGAPARSLACCGPPARAEAASRLARPLHLGICIPQPRLRPTSVQARRSDSSEIAAYFGLRGADRAAQPNQSRSVGLSAEHSTLDRQPGAQVAVVAAESGTATPVRRANDIPGTGESGLA